MTDPLTAPREPRPAASGRGGARVGGGAWRRGAGPGERGAVSRAVAGERRARMAEQWDLDEECLRRLGALKLEQPGRAGRLVDLERASEAVRKLGCVALGGPGRGKGTAGERFLRRRERKSRQRGLR